MVSRAFPAIILACVLAIAQARAEGEGGRGFAGLGEAAAGFAEVLPGRELAFPRDHGAHPDHRIEWWYLTANLEGEDGARYGVQWTLFRQAQAPSGGEGWRDPQIWMAHIAATSADSHHFDHRLARGGFGQAGVAAEPFEAWLDDWSLKGEDGGFDRLTVSAVGGDFSYSLALAAEGPIALQGRDGFSVKSRRDAASGLVQASYYYSQPHFEASGRLTLGGREIAVRGVAWFDHEWSSQPLAADQTGWDWFSLHLASGEKAMLFRLRRSEGGAHDLAGNWIDAKGRSSPLDPSEIRIAPIESHASGAPPTRWRVEAASKGLAVVVAALNPDAWQGGLFPYWEGPVAVSGSHEGIGYLEMTGYRR